MTKTYKSTGTTTMEGKQGYIRKASQGVVTGSNSKSTLLHVEIKGVLPVMQPLSSKWSQCQPEMIYPFNNRESFYMTVSLGLADFDWLARPFHFADKIKLP